MNELLDDYIAACNYPGRLDVACVEKHLGIYLDSLGIRRGIIQIRRGWKLADHPGLENHVSCILNNLAIRRAQAAGAALGARNARNARNARDAGDVTTALAARDSRDARVAGDARVPPGDVLTTRAVRKARAARVIRDARETRAACVARDARDASEASAARRAAHVAGDARKARAARVAGDAREARAESDACAAYDLIAMRTALDTHETRAAGVAGDVRDAGAAREARKTNTVGTVFQARSPREVLISHDVLGDRATRAAHETLAVRNAFAAGDDDAAYDALHDFATWCIMRHFWGGWDLSWVATTWFGAVELNETRKMEWSLHLLRAFLAGCWFIYWTADILYWVAKPVLTSDDHHRLHNESGPALENDVEDMYFWHGTCIPRDWIVHKDRLTPSVALKCRNVEQRRVACEIIGWTDILEHPSLNPKVIDADEPHIGTLIQVDLPEAPEQWFLKYRCATGRWFAEPVNDKSFNTALKANAGGNGWRSGFGDPEAFIPFVRV